MAKSIKLPFPPLNQPMTAPSGLITPAPGSQQSNQLVNEPWAGYFRNVDQIVRGISQPQNLVCLGDSRTKGAYVYDSSYPAQLGALLGWNPLNLGVNGATTNGAGGTNSVLDSQVPQAIAAYNGNFTNIALLCVGVNDAGLGTALSVIQAAYISIVLALKNAGFRVMALTIAPSNYASYPNPSYLTTVAGINSWLVPGGSGADLVCNIANDPRLANPANTAYFNPDELHFIAPGYACWAQDVRAVLGALLGP